MYAAPHASRGPPTHRVAYGLAAWALLQLLPYLPVFPPKSLPAAWRAQRLTNWFTHAECIFSIIDKIADDLGARSAAAWRHQITHYVWFN